MEGTLDDASVANAKDSVTTAIRVATDFGTVLRALAGTVARSWQQPFCDTGNGSKTMRADPQRPDQGSERSFLRDHHPAGGQCTPMLRWQNLDGYRGYHVDMVDEPTRGNISRFTFTATPPPQSPTSSFQRSLEITNQLAHAHHINSLGYLRRQGEIWIHRVIDRMVDGGARDIAPIVRWRCDAETGLADFATMPDAVLQRIERLR